MNALLISNLSFSLFFCLYVVGFKRLTFFQWNRFYLLFALIFSACVPWLAIPAFSATNQDMAVIQLPTIVLNPEQSPQMIPVFEVVYWLYWSGVIVGALLLVHALWKIRTLRMRAGKTSSKDYLVAEGTHAFSFFNRIQIGAAIERDVRRMIIDHEEVHRDQWHSIDVMVYSIARIIAWFNPFVHIALREVQLNHEFIADAEAHRNHGTDYQYSLLNQALDTKVFQLTNSFFTKSIIKNRIKMMNKRKSRKGSLALYALILPTVLLALWLSACNNEPGVPDRLQEQELVEAIKPSADKVYSKSDDLDVMPSFPGGQEAMLDFFKEGFKYPAELKEGNVEGRVLIQFIVGEDGNLSSFQSIESDDERLVEPAISFIKSMPNWEPGMMDDTPVKVKMVLPLQYTMN